MNSTTQKERERQAKFGEKGWSANKDTIRTQNKIRNTQINQHHNKYFSHNTQRESDPTSIALTTAHRESNNTSSDWSHNTDREKATRQLLLSQPPTEKAARQLFFCRMIITKQNKEWSWKWSSSAELLPLYTTVVLERVRENYGLVLWNKRTSTENMVKYWD